MLIPEDGSGHQYANSYASVTAADAYLALRGNIVWDALTIAQKEAALINATDFIEATYSEVWKGQRRTQMQALSWPRIDVFVEEYELPSTSLPQRLIDATIQMAMRAASGEPLVKDQTQRVVKEKVDVVETTYSEHSSPQSMYPFVSRLLQPLMRVSSGAGDLMVARLVR